MMGRGMDRGIDRGMDRGMEIGIGSGMDIWIEGRVERRKEGGIERGIDTGRYCRTGHVLAVPIRLSFAGCPVLAVQFWLLCPSCAVPAALS